LMVRIGTPNLTSYLLIKTPDPFPKRRCHNSETRLTEKTAIGGRVFQSMKALCNRKIRM
jgi:hypothetical protein